MGIIELIILSIGLAMDAFAVSICKGISMKKMNWKKAGIIGLYFGGFQAGMPVIGYLLGKGFENVMKSFSSYVAFGLLALIGINMIREALGNEEDDEQTDDTSFKTMLVLAIATSIDALTVGITFACLEVNIILAAVLIGTITCAISVIGTKIGNKFGDKYEKKAEIAGGIILILLGLKILLEYFGIINF